MVLSLVARALGVAVARTCRKRPSRAIRMTYRPADVACAHRMTEELVTSAAETPYEKPLAAWAVGGTARTTARADTTTTALRRMRRSSRGRGASRRPP